MKVPWGECYKTFKPVANQMWCCRHAASQCLNRCWPRSLSIYSVTSYNGPSKDISITFCLRHLSHCVYKICLCLCHLYWHYRHIWINLTLSVYHKWLYFVCATSVCYWQIDITRLVSNIRRTLVGNKIVDHSYVVGASPIGAAPTTSSFST